MSRKLVKSEPRALDDLPLFREPEPAAEPTPEPAAENPEDASDEPATDDAELTAALESLDESEPVDPPAPAPRFRARRAREMPASTGHVAWFTTGFVLLGAGATFAVLAAMKSAPALTGALLALGLSPGLVLACGLAALGAGTLLARHGRQAAALADLESTLHDLLVVADQVDATTRALREADESRASAAMSGDEISQVLFALQRHEEKLTNLTKATKTFGKPLVEMTTQMADATAQVAQIQSTLQALRVVAENGFQRSEETLRTHAEVLRQCNEQLANDSLQPALAELRGKVEELRDSLDERITGALRDVAAGPEAVGARVEGLVNRIPDAIGSRVEALVHDLPAALGTKVEDLRKALDALGSDLAARVGELQQRKAPASVAVDLSPLQQAIEQLRRDVTALASTPRAGTAEPAAPAEKPTKSAPAPSGDDVPASGLAQSIAGERTTKANNVLGAIAKLKKMRS